MLDETARDLAALHATAFDGTARWSADAFARALVDPGCFLVRAPGGAGFALGRHVADEVELLTLVVAAPRRRMGLGRTLLAEFEARARARGATAAFLEVADGNAPARALYDAAAWRVVGRRPRYYDDGSDAVLMRKALDGAA